MSNVSEIVRKDICSGCGVCAGVCPVSAIKIEFNRIGEYNPVISDKCTDCGVCMRVCPFSDQSRNEDVIALKLFSEIQGIRHKTEVGFYLECFAGYSPVFRTESASGGLVSHTLKQLFESGSIDKAVCVVPNNDSEKLFKFRVLTSPGQLSSSAGSAYYPVEMSEVLGEIAKTPGNYALVGLPCFIRAFRNAAVCVPALNARVKCCLGLVCGQIKSRAYTDYLARKSGLDEPLKSVKFRCKDGLRPAGDFFCKFIGVSGVETKAYWTEGVGKVFTGRMFTPRACSFCDDVFAECADAVFMDAWLPEYSKDSKGTSLVLSRSPQLSRMLAQVGPSVSLLPVERIISSQAGVTNIKREQLSYRLNFAVKAGIPVPEKRVKPLLFLGFFNRMTAQLTQKINDETRRTLGGLPDGRMQVQTIDTAVRGLFWQKSVFEKTYSLLSRARSLLSYVRK